MQNTRRVYSTQTGRICPACEKPISDCACKKSSQSPRSEDIIRIRREVKGRKGKTVTVAYGFGGSEADLKKLVAELKRKCGSGGSVKDGTIVIQGDHRQTLLAELKNRNFKVKPAGG